MAGHFGGNPYAWNGGGNNPHISRYFSARGWVMPGETVIDAGCGTGYGSHMISQIAKKVIGVDVDPGCIDYAKEHWQSKNIKFRVLDLGKGELPNADVIISIENMEHVNGMEHFIDQMTKHIKRICVICVPMGGSSYSYTKEEQASPGGENNDFFSTADVTKLFESRGWKLQWDHPHGYSNMFIFYKKPPKIPKGVKL
jgi:protein-L-isoaspartate O-methyltransferase